MKHIFGILFGYSENKMANIVCVHVKQNVSFLCAAKNMCPNATMRRFHLWTILFWSFFWCFVLFERLHKYFMRTKVALVHNERVIACFFWYIPENATHTHTQQNPSQANCFIQKRIQINSILNCELKKKKNEINWNEIYAMYHIDRWC